MLKNHETVLDVSRWDQHPLNPKIRDRAAVDWCDYFTSTSFDDDYADDTDDDRNIM